MPLFDWTGTVGGTGGAGLPTLDSIGNRFGYWQNVPDVPGATMPVKSTVDALPPGWLTAVSAGAAPQAPGAVGYIPPEVVPRGATTDPALLKPAGPSYGTMLARGLANFDFRPAQVSRAPDFAFTGRPVTLATLGGQRGVQAFMRPRPSYG
jgi:hypothetical protein